MSGSAQLLHDRETSEPVDPYSNVMVLPAAQPIPRGERPRLQLVRESDAELLCRIAERDPDAFEVLYQRYARPVYGLALRRLRDRGKSEDAVQDAFIAVWRSAATYKPERGPARPWLFTIARNAIIDSLRGKRTVDNPALEDAPEPVSAEPTPEEWAEDEWRSFCTHAAVAELPERERVPLELAYWHGLSQSEIAHRLRLPIGTIKTRTRVGLARLAERLEGKL
jgi:RNA polymerase sigma-70 factor (ECF subfamily)